jgi:hypothetical protein
VAVIKIKRNSLIRIRNLYMNSWDKTPNKFLHISAERLIGFNAAISIRIDGKYDSVVNG